MCEVVEHTGHVEGCTVEIVGTSDTRLPAFWEIRQGLR